MSDIEQFECNTINKFILGKHHLTEETKIDNIIQIAHDICGLHSTSQSTPYMSLYARSNKFQKEFLDSEAYGKNNLGKVRGMRKTVFLFPKEVLPFIYAATKKQYATRLEGYLERLRMPLDKYHQLSEKVENVLEGKAKSVVDIKKKLDTKENISAVVNLLCDQKKLIRNKPIKGWRDKRNTYSIFQEYFPEMNLEEYDVEQGIDFLIHYYIEHYGPVTENDIFWWTGLNKTPVRKALEKINEKLDKINIAGIYQTYLLLKSDKERILKMNRLDAPTVNILPDLDPYLMGYKDRERYVTQEKFHLTYDKSGNATTSILVDGKIVGVWDFVSSKEPTIKIYIFDKQPKDIIEEIKESTLQIGEFIFEKDFSIKECSSMNPLNTRTPGEVLTPLKNC